MTTQESRAARPGMIVIGVLAWLWVLVPLAYGLVNLVAKIPALFGS